MPSDARDNKAILRTALRKRLSLLSLEDKKAQSARIRNLILDRVSGSCAIFAGTSHEPDLLPLLESSPHISWLFPKVISPGVMEFYRVTHHSQLSPGAFDILEPREGEAVSSSEINTIMCPGLAFTKIGQRMGQGGGFYDRLLEKATAAHIYGACFDEQIVQEIPEESHDQRMLEILHPSLGS